MVILDNPQTKGPGPVEAILPLHFIIFAERNYIVFIIDN